MLIGAALLAGALGGCAVTWERGEWQRPDVTASEQTRDEYECARTATLSADTGPARARLYADCMRARGYRPAP